MITDELYRAVRALVACKDWSQEQALEHLLRMPEKQRGCISASLKAWQVVPADDEPAYVDLDESLAAHLRGDPSNGNAAREPWRPQGSVPVEHRAESVE